MLGIFDPVYLYGLLFDNRSWLVLEVKVGNFTAQFVAPFSIIAA